MDAELPRQGRKLMDHELLGLVRTCGRFTARRHSAGSGGCCACHRRQNGFRGLRGLGPMRRVGPQGRYGQLPGTCHIRATEHRTGRGDGRSSWDAASQQARQSLESARHVALSTTSALAVAGRDEVVQGQQFVHEQGLDEGGVELFPARH